LVRSEQLMTRIIPITNSAVYKYHNFFIAFTS
jgi:hypothetical protein